MLIVFWVRETAKRAFFADCPPRKTVRLGGSVNTGPFFQGLAKPANDLPRGCSPEDVYRVAIVTALQCG